jgi:hypothetical protein
MGYLLIEFKYATSLSGHNGNTGPGTTLAIIVSVIVVIIIIVIVVGNN